MLRIVICDDEAAMIETVRAITAHFLRTQGVDGEIQCYSRSDTLRDDLDDGSFYDLFLLDIEMPKVDGMTLAEKIHAELPAATMIFITFHLEYAISAYEFAIFRYIPKTQLAEKLPQALADFYKLYALERGDFYTIAVKNHVEKLATAIFSMCSWTGSTPSSICAADARHRCAKASAKWLENWVPPFSWRTAVRSSIWRT